jgi:hypothetical protein
VEYWVTIQYTKTTDTVGVAVAQKPIKKARARKSAPAISAPEESAPEEEK